MVLQRIIVLGFFGEGKEERRKAYLAERAEVKKEKELQKMKENGQ